MAAYSSLGEVRKGYQGTKDNIVVVNFLGGVPGGRTLDVSAFEGVENIFGGHIICYKNEEYYPLPVEDGNYVALSEEEGEKLHEPVGVLKHTIRTDDPRAAIMTMGQVNAAASPYPVTDEIKAALPRLEFLY